uniref:Putative secreted protein n=1 Tax=Anopheles darlingi TaxID=43151 RepID=A0A2M4D7C6_ANODA
MNAFIGRRILASFLLSGLAGSFGVLEPPPPPVSEDELVPPPAPIPMEPPLETAAACRAALQDCVLRFDAIDSALSVVAAAGPLLPSEAEDGGTVSKAVAGTSMSMPRNSNCGSDPALTSSFLPR